MKTKQSIHEIQSDHLTFRYIVRKFRIKPMLPDRCLSANLRHKQLQMSLVVRKPVFRICENKDADQLTAKLISALFSLHG